jgi:hypothetical protein
MNPKKNEKVKSFESRRDPKRENKNKNAFCELKR